MLEVSSSLVTITNQTVSIEDSLAVILEIMSNILVPTGLYQVWLKYNYQEMRETIIIRELFYL